MEIISSAGTAMLLPRRRSTSLVDSGPLAQARAEL